MSYYAFIRKHSIKPLNSTLKVLCWIHVTLKFQMLWQIQCPIGWSNVSWNPPIFRKGTGTRDQIANIRWIIEKAREFQKNIFFCFIDYAKAFDCEDHNKLWKILKEKEIPDHLYCLLRSLYTGQETTVRTRHGKKDWFPIGKEVCQGCILLPCLFNFYAEYIMRNVRLDEAHAGIKIVGEIPTTSDMQMTPTLWQKVERN